MRVILCEGLHHNTLCLTSLPAVKFLMGEECQAREPLRIVEANALKTVSLLACEDFQRLIEPRLTSPLRFGPFDWLSIRDSPSPAVF